MSLTGKIIHPKNVTSTSKRRVAQNLGRSGYNGKRNSATVTLINYFKMKAKADHLHFGGHSPSEKTGVKTPLSPGSNQTVPNNKTATSLILFKEVNSLYVIHYLADMKLHINQGFVCNLTAPRLMSYLMTTSTSSQPSRLSWPRLKGKSFWPPRVKTHTLVSFWIDELWC